MARTTQEIYDEIVSSTNAQVELQNLSPSQDHYNQFKADFADNTSKMAFWRMIAFLIAVCFKTHETLFDIHKKEVEAIASNNKAGTLPWYVDQVLKWQYNDPLVYVDEQYQYLTIDTSKQIVSLCAAEDRENGRVIIKAAKLGANNLPGPLDSAELNALTGYIQKIRFPGTAFLLISQDADLLKLRGVVYFDPIHSQNSIAAKVENAITAYITNLSFNGVLKVNALVDAIQEVEGIKDFVVHEIASRYANVPYTPVSRVQTAVAGYFEIDPSFPLSTGLTYQPSTV